MVDDGARSVFDQLTDGVIVTAGGGVIAYANPAAHRIFDWPAGGLVGASVDLLVPLPMHERHTVERAASCEGALSTVAMADRAVSGVKRDGRVFNAHVSLTRLGDAGTTTVAVVRDLDALLHRDRLRTLGTLAASVVHDIRNAACPVVMAAEELIDNRVTGPEARESLELILVAARDVVAVAERVRGHAKGARARSVCGPVYPAEVAQSALRMVSPSLRQRRPDQRVVTSSAYESATPAVIGDDILLREAVLNLIVNALDAMPAGGRLGVSITLRETPDMEGISPFPAWRPPAGASGYALIEVIDTGTGMDEATLRRCCDRDLPLPRPCPRNAVIGRCTNCVK
jgi:PAS domain S-box-containing protein